MSNESIKVSNDILEKYYMSIKLERKGYIVVFRQCLRFF